MILLQLLAFVFGAVIGSFLNVVILRFISNETFVKGRSKCMACQKELRWWELAPIFSFIFLRGRCARCHAPISIQYPIVELVMGMITVAVLSTKIPAFAGMTAGAGMTTTTWIPAFAGMTTLIIAALLIILFMIDLYTLLLPDIFVVILLLFVAIRLAVTQAPAPDTFYGVLAGAGFLLFLWAVTRGRGIGLGDIKLMIPLGALFGLWGTITLLFIAFIAGGIISLFLLIRQKAQLKTQIPFGPFLAGTAILLLLFPSIINWFAVTIGFTSLF